MVELLIGLRTEIVERRMQTAQPLAKALTWWYPVHDLSVPLTRLKELSFWLDPSQNRENDEQIDRETKISGFGSQTATKDRDFRLLSRPIHARIAKCGAS